LLTRITTLFYFFFSQPKKYFDPDLQTTSGIDNQNTDIGMFDCAYGMHYE
jgi:hypothetical protein